MKLNRISALLVTIAALCSVMTPVCTPHARSSSTDPQKRAGNTTVINFPEERSLGLLSITTPQLKRTQAPARGRVAFPKGSILNLKVNYETGRDLAPFRKLPPDALHNLSLRKLEIGDDQLENIAHLSGLTTLDMEYTDISDRGLNHLSHLKNLESLNLRSTLISGRALSGLKPFTKLQRLNISSDDLGDVGLEPLLSLKSLQRLNVAKSGIGDRALRSIAPMKQLAYLNIEYNSRVSDRGIAALQGMNLKELHISHSGVSFKALKYFKLLPKLELIVYERNFSDDEVEKISKGLPKCAVQNRVKHRKIEMDIFEPLH